LQENGIRPAPLGIEQVSSGDVVGRVTDLVTDLKRQIGVLARWIQLWSAASRERS